MLEATTKKFQIALISHKLIKILYLHTLRIRVYSQTPDILIYWITLAFTLSSLVFAISYKKLRESRFLYENREGDH